MMGLLGRMGFQIGYGSDPWIVTATVHGRVHLVGTWIPPGAGPIFYSCPPPFSPVIMQFPRHTSLCLGGRTSNSPFQHCQCWPKSDE